MNLKIAIGSLIDGYEMKPLSSKSRKSPASPSVIGPPSSLPHHHLMICSSIYWPSNQSDPDICFGLF